MSDLLVIAVASAGIPSVAWMVVAIRRLAVMRRITERALDGSAPAQIPDVLRASADLASTLAADLGRPGRMSLPDPQREPTPEPRNERAHA
jgi:hypothetical protein